jgi:hypothetical protein
MINKENTQIDTVDFKAVNIRNRGTFITDNGLDSTHILRGQSMRIYPGGVLSATSVKIEADSFIVDAMGIVEADGSGYCSGGKLRLISVRTYLCVCVRACIRKLSQNLYIKAICPHYEIRNLLKSETSIKKKKCLCPSHLPKTVFTISPYQFST